MRREYYILICALLFLISCGGKEEIDTNFSDYSESHFLADIRSGIDLDEVAERIFESEIAELHGAEIAGIGFVTFVGNREDHYMLSQNLETKALDMLIKLPKEDKASESIEIIWPLEWAGKSFEEFSANRLLEPTSE